MNEHTAAAYAAILGVGRFDVPFETPELRRQLTLLRRQIRAGAPDKAIVQTIRRITALRLRAARAARRCAAVLEPRLEARLGRAKDGLLPALAH